MHGLNSLVRRKAARVESGEWRVASGEWRENSDQ